MRFFCMEVKCQSVVSYPLLLPAIPNKCQISIKHEQDRSLPLYVSVDYI